MRRHTLIENTKLGPHCYCVTIGTDIGQFTGVVECREEDYAFESQYFGWELAELKAEIEYAKAKKKYYGALWQNFVVFWREMSETRTYDGDAFWVKKIAQRIDSYEDQERYWRDRANDLKEAYRVKILTFDALNKARKSKGV